ncbi:hypothetical protein Rsub_02953 [Raphidocelis subcapitata]|uniref:Uncharacterized protein n=1 Tax=Raphidocelis subcapitata TaxID=307507 RepID=A0A2V0NW52_9CHLO|nr:hypothetical protein Rsub_02953 [Raphidocelis subcapitata]|eukprot:GBF89783.1 hypothetical protein Rsub_02953 [Raphidocelis subcapitata]
MAMSMRGGLMNAQCRPRPASRRAARAAAPPTLRRQRAPLPRCRCQQPAVEAPQESALRGYLEGEARLKPYQADRVLRELAKRPDADVAWLQERLGAVAAALGAPASSGALADALYNGGLDLLEADAGEFKQRLGAIKDALPGVDAVELASREPRLLYSPGAAAAVKQVLAKLTTVYPYKSSNKKRDVLQLVAEYPELLVRMGAYAGDAGIKKVQDLPVDIQNRILRSYC